MDIKYINFRKSRRQMSVITSKDELVYDAHSNSESHLKPYVDYDTYRKLYITLKTISEGTGKDATVIREFSRQCLEEIDHQDNN